MDPTSYYSDSTTRNFLTFANTTAIAYRQNLAAPVNFSPLCNSSCVRKRQKITSTVYEQVAIVVPRAVPSS